MSPPRRSPLLLFALAACTPEIPVTGGFRETIIDKSIHHGQQLETVDLDGDGRTDIVAAFSLTDAVHVYLNQGEGVFEPISISGAGSIVAADTITLDVDGDADLDVVAVALTQRRFFNISAGELVWYENPGDPRGEWTTRPISRPDLADTSSSSDDLVWGGTSVTAGDLDGDGIADLVVGQNNASDAAGRIHGNRVTWYKSAGDGTFTGPLAIDTAATDVADVLIADADADGRLDVLAAGAQELAWYRNSGTQGQDPRFVKYTVANLTQTKSLAFADVDGDGVPELVAAEASLTSSITIAIYEAPARASDPWTRTPVASGFGAANTDRPRLALADFDGDGALDIAVSDSLGDLRVYRRAGVGYEERDVRGGYAGLSGLSAADMDGDGKVDLVTSTFEFGSRDRLAWWRNESF